MKLPEFDPAKEELSGGSVTEDVRKELAEAMADSPIGTFLGAVKYLVSSQNPLQHGLIIDAIADHRLARLLAFQLIRSNSLPIWID